MRLGLRLHRQTQPSARSSASCGSSATALRSESKAAVKSPDCSIARPKLKCERACGLQRYRATHPFGRFGKTPDKKICHAQVAERRVTRKEPRTFDGVRERLLVLAATKQVLSAPQHVLVAPMSRATGHAAYTSPRRTRRRIGRTPDCVYTLMCKLRTNFHHASSRKVASQKAFGFCSKARPSSP